MSKLTEYLAESGWDNPNLKEVVLELLPAHDAAIGEQAQRKQMEALYAAACWMCEGGEMPAHGEDHRGEGWWHCTPGISPRCKASDIRAAWAKAHPEVKNGD
jgi:hypothetical protein